jgi:biopolymer transport protein ExbB
MKRSLTLIFLLVFALPMTAQAWWSGDWKYRKKIQINTSPTGADLKDNVADAMVAVRLHSGNFLFTDSKPDGSDLRFVASDDKTPLNYFVEEFDSVNQLALVWVQLPRVSAASSADYFYMYSGNDKASNGGDAKRTYDSHQLLALEFAQAQPPFKDTSAYGHVVAGDGVKPDPTGLFDGAAAFDGTPLKVTPQAATQIAAGGGMSFSVWVRPTAAGGHLLQWGPVLVELDGDAVSAHVGKDGASAGKLTPGTWNQVVVTASDHLVIYVNGVQAVSQASSLPELSGEIVIGEGFHGSLDALRLANTARSAAWVQLDAALATEGKLLSYGESEAGEEGGSSSYIKILFASLTLDAKVVIGILGVMFLIAVSVMINRGVVLRRATKGNEQFLRGFESRSQEFLDPNSGIAKGFNQATLPGSSLARMYETGIRELRPRLARSSGALPAESLAAIKASIDSTVIRENQRLNRLMVLLTIAISGGPFLGLLGTVVGVMITFASIAAAGDVNINAIAPGIAAALLATVAGLGVAIPSLFGYNYLITQIKSISADMQAFSDEFVCRLAEVHNDPHPVRAHAHA